MESIKSDKLILAEGYVSLVFNTLLFVIKYWVGIITGSIALIADAWHTISDSITSLILIIGSKISSQPADKEHPFGHGNAEMITGIIIATLLAVVSVNFFVDSIKNIIKNVSVTYGTPAILVTILSIIVKELLAQYAFWTHRKTSSHAVKADGWHHRSDAISSLVILIGIFLGPYLWWIDSALGIIVSMLILYTAYGILKDAANKLFGEKPDEELIKKLQDICNKIPENVVHLHHVLVHKYGKHTELTFHIRLENECTIAEAHEVTNKLEKLVFTELNADSTIHVEPLNQ